MTLQPFAIQQAKDYAHEAHDSIGQRRKYSNEPYWVHTDAVAQLVADVGCDEETVVAAHLHDILEDVWPKNPQFHPQAIERWFNSHVLDLVLELTDKFTKKDYPHLNRKARKLLEHERIGSISIAAKTIKLADIIDNTRSIVASDKEFAMVYLREMLDLLPFLVDGNATLLQQASVQIIGACAAVGINIPVIRA